MTESNIKAAGYIRVSSAGQVENESLETQRNSIEHYAKRQNWILSDIYEDAGISGGTVKDRHGLQQCLQDGQRGKFDRVIVHRLSRFGRNARELLENHETMTAAGVELVSISEGIDFTTKYGKAMLGFLAILAELEREIIKETMQEGAKTKSLKGGYSRGRTPFGRYYDEDEQMWKVDTQKQRIIKDMVQRFLKDDASIADLAEELNHHGLDETLNETNLRETFKHRAGTTRIETFDGDEIEQEIPALLSEAEMKACRQKFARNAANTRTDARDYLLSGGLIRCFHCRKTYYGQTNGQYAYYLHTGKKYDKCEHGVPTVPMEKLDNAVIQAMWDNVFQLDYFHEAIEESLPDEDKITELKSDIAYHDRELSAIEKKIDTLVDAYLEGTLQKSTVQEREQQYLESRNFHREKKEQLQQELDTLPDPEEVKAQADEIRQEFLDKYDNLDTLQSMPYKKKRQLLEWFFTGESKAGEPHGIYVVNKTGRGQNTEVEFLIAGRVGYAVATLDGSEFVKRGTMFDPRNWEELTKENPTDPFLRTKSLS